MARMSLKASHACVAIHMKFKKIVKDDDFVLLVSGQKGSYSTALDSEKPRERQRGDRYVAAR